MLPARGERPAVAALADLPAESDEGAVDPTTVLSAAQARQVVAHATAGLYQPSCSLPCSQAHG